jgi:GDPmannose 4,6-dehydratase
LYNAGSSECFGDIGGEPADESTPFHPRSPYAVAKAAAFWEVANYREAYDLYACTGILFNHESPLRPERFVTRKIVAGVRRIAEGTQKRLVLGNLSIERDWGWTPEYVNAMWLLLQQSQPEDLVIATGKSHTLEEFAHAAFACAGVEVRDRITSDPALLRPTELRVGRANPTTRGKS